MNEETAEEQRKREARNDKCFRIAELLMKRGAIDEEIQKLINSL